MNRLHAIVRGRVQGVNFRATTQWEAHRLNLQGWVRNNFDGTVEVVAEGPRDQLYAFLEFLRQGPAAAEVEHVDINWHEPIEQLNQFSIRR